MSALTMEIQSPKNNQTVFFEYGYIKKINIKMFYVTFLPVKPIFYLLDWILLLRFCNR